MEEATVVDYTEYIDEIEEFLEAIVSNTDSLKGFVPKELNDCLLDLLASTENVFSQLQEATEIFQQVNVYAEYACGVAIFVVVVALLYFAYKFLRMFF